MKEERAEGSGCRRGEPREKVSRGQEEEIEGRKRTAREVKCRLNENRVTILNTTRSTICETSATINLQTKQESKVIYSVWVPIRTAADPGITDTRPKGTTQISVQR